MNTRRKKLWSRIASSALSLALAASLVPAAWAVQGAHTHTEACKTLTCTLGGTLICGKEEHTHSEECYQSSDSAEIPDDTGTTEAAVSSTPSCGKEEHTHSGACYHQHSDACYTWNCVLVESVSVTSSLRLIVGQSASLSYSITPSSATNQNISWSSSDEAVATCSNGIVTAIRAGKAAITVTTEDGNYTASCEVTVTDPVKVTGITIKGTSTSILIGKTLQLTATISPNDATNKAVTWRSSDGSIATVSSSGLVTGKSAGPVTITATAQDGSAVYGIYSISVQAANAAISPTSLSLMTGGSQTITVSGLSSNATVTWSSSSKAITLQSSNTISSGKNTCTVKASNSTVSNATVTARVSYPGSAPQDLTCRVSVSNPSISLNKTALTLASGKTSTLTATTVPANATVNWSSNNTKVATVSGKTGSSVTVNAVSAGTATITATFTYNSKNYSVSCTVTVSSSADTIYYTTSANTPVTFDAEDFEDVCWDLTGKSLSYVTFTLPSSSYGTLYYDYVSSRSYDSKVSASTLYRASKSPYLSNVAFVPKSNYTGTVTISYTGYATNGVSFSGQISIAVGKSDGGVTYTTTANTSVDLSDTDFNTYCRNETGATMDYVQFSTPSAAKGVLYHNYSSSSSSKVTDSAKYYRSSSPYLDDLTFVPARNYSGTVEIPFTGCAINGRRFSGTLTIHVGGTGDITYTASAGSAVTFTDSDFNSYCKKETGYNMDFVRFTLPSSSKGVLYQSYSTSATSSNKKATSSTKFYYSSSPYLEDVTFVPASTSASTTVEIPFAGEDIRGNIFSGTVIISYTARINAETIRYSTSGTPVAFRLQDFTSACSARNGVSLTSVSFTLPNSSYGKLYYGYASPAKPGTAVSANTAYRASGSPTLSGIVFVPKAEYTGTVTINYTGIDQKNATYSGAVEITVTAPKASATFQDAGSGYSWAAGSIDFLYAANVVTGTDDAGTRYSPAQNIRRGDFILMLYRAFNLPAASTADNFPDVPANSYYAQAIASAKALGIAQGTDGRFSPQASLSRQDAMVLIQRTMNATGRGIGNGSSTALNAFSDRDKVSSYAQSAVSSMVQYGIIKGDNNKLNPTNPLSRAEMAVILHRALTL